MATHLTVLTLLATLSGFPLGSLLCGGACVPEQVNAAPSCHQHDGTAAGGAALTSIHLCDEDGERDPMIGAAAFASSVLDAAALTPLPIAGSGTHVPRTVWRYPPGGHRVPFPSSEAVLRI
jgi:hypothetical protein